MRTGIGISDTCTATSRPSSSSTITGLDSIQRWATVRRRSSSTRWRQSTPLAPRPCSFFNQQQILNPRE